MFINLKWFLLILACFWLCGRMGWRSLKWTFAIIGLAFTHTFVGALMGYMLGWLAEGIFQRPKVHFHYERRTYNGQSSSDMQPDVIPSAVLSAYRTLGISPYVSDDEVRQAYRQMAKKYHPDRVATLGDDVKRAAERKFKEINDAKEKIFKARGI